MNPQHDMIMPDLNLKSNPLSPICALMLIFLCTAPLQGAKAQECDVVYEAVTRLPHPEPGVQDTWNTVFKGLSGKSDFVSAIELEEGVIAIGHIRQKGLKPAVLAVGFDDIGRVRWQNITRVEGLSAVVKALPTEDGFVLLANVTQKNGKQALWLGFFDKQAKLVSKKIINDKRFDLEGRDFITAHQGRGWLVSVSASYSVGSGDLEKKISNASIYRLDKKGNETYSRAYYMGSNSEVLGLSVAYSLNDNPEYLATGYFENDNGKKKGWVFKLADDLSLKWQKEFGRGLSAKLRHVIPFDKRYLLVWGDVSIANSISKKQDRGAWLMMLSSSKGEAIWQRYYMAEDGLYDYYADGLHRNEDKTLTALLSARIKAGALKMDDVEGARYIDYAQLMTLTARGIPIEDQAYYYGHGARVNSLLVQQEGTRLMVGSAYTPEKTMFERAALDDHKMDNEKEPLREYGRVQLPEADVPEKAKKGLALLQNKIRNQDVEVHEAPQESAMTEGAQEAYVWRGWAVSGKNPKAYTDPCLGQ